MGVWYCTREDVKSALDYKITARNNAAVDRAIETASRNVEKACARVFYPTTATRTFDWPNFQYAPPWKLWLNQNELISASQITAGGVVIPSEDYILRPENSGPPYNRVELLRNTSASFADADSPQEAVAIQGVFGYSDDTDPAGSLTAAITSTTQTLVNVSNGGAVGVGDSILIDQEWIWVSGKLSEDTGETIQADIDSSKASQVVGVSDGTEYNVDEVILIDAEYMLIVDIAGNNLIVTRNWDGSTLAAHTSGAEIYAKRQLMVKRGQLGSTAATHSDSVTIATLVPPGPVHELSLAEAINICISDSSGWARTIGSGDSQRDASGAGLADLRHQVYQSYARKGRMRRI